MAELMLGLLVGVLLAAELNLGGDSARLLAGAVAAGLYLLSCLVLPRRRCWRCVGRRYRGDGRGNLRDRNCRACGGAGDARRVGAVLLGAGVRR